MALDWDRIAGRLLDEDAPAGDLTTEALDIGDRPGRIRFSARADMTIAGVELAAALCRRAGVVALAHCRSGARVAKGALLVEGEGPAGALHLAWKAAQTEMEFLSGLATAARAIVDAVEAVNPKIRVACTRKTFPGDRLLSHFAVKAGGAILHRTGLSETLLVFAEHRAFLPDADFATLAKRLREAAPEKRLAIEVSSVEEACRAIDAGFETIQLEKFSVDATAATAGYARKTSSDALIAAAGGVNAANAADYVRAGAGLIVTSAPYNAPPRDVQVRVVAA